jgi:type II secretory pathway pseudopilin PulG
MNRQTQTASHGGAGFSFVELLITIVIAGLIFAAMVPVFVGATQKNSADAVRLQAANVAQDKIEKIRQLPYGAIWADSSNTAAGQATANLYDPDFADGQFGPSTPLDTGSGSRTIHTDYQVTLYPAAATGLASQYKVVTVTAYWDAPPKPVKPVVLQTIIYRQYAGPPLNSFSTNPAIDDNGVLGGHDLASVTLAARVDMSAGATPASVQFKIAAFGGQTIASRLVKTSDLNSFNGFWYDGVSTFYWTWDCSTAANTVYDLQATAYSTDDYAGNTMHLYPRIDHVVQPAPPGAVVAVAGDAAVSLSWGVSTASDLASYEVFRATSAAGPWDVLITTIGITPPATAPAATYLDNSPPLPNDTTYYYAVGAVTTDGRRSALALSNPVTPTHSADVTPPAAPQPVTATAAASAATITLAWGAAIDPGLPSTGIKQYEIWRSANGSTWGASPLAVWTNLTNLSYPDAAAGWATTWYYRIRAIDFALNVGAWSATVQATTVGEPFHDLRISVKSGNNACNVWVLNAGSGRYYDVSGADKGTSPPAGTAIAKNGSVTFVHLPDGAYTVYAATGGAPGAKTYGVTVLAPYGSLTGVTP